MEVVETTTLSMQSHGCLVPKKELLRARLVQGEAPWGGSREYVN